MHLPLVSGKHEASRHPNWLSGLRLRAYHNALLPQPSDAANTELEACCLQTSKPVRTCSLVNEVLKELEMPAASPIEFVAQEEGPGEEAVANDVDRAKQRCVLGEQALSPALCLPPPSQGAK